MNSCKMGTKTSDSAYFCPFRSFAPTLGGYLTQAFGFFSLGYVGVFANVICLAIIPFARLKNEL